MDMLKKLQKHKLKVITVLLYILTLIYNPTIFNASLKTTGGYLKEMVQILPPVFIISGLITVWVPKEVIMKSFGKKSGFKGSVISLLLGSISAGPIYAAFPVAFSLLSKGASISNIVIIISSWAVVKVPMMIVESKFLGLDFMLVRALFTIPAILAIGYIVGKVIKDRDIPLEDSDNKVIEIEGILPQYNCKACGYKNCKEYAIAMVDEGEELSKCKVGGIELENKLKNKLSVREEY